jgi:DNA-binding YbaB/EbfC family protein
MKNIGQIMKQAQEMQKKMAEMQEKLESLEIPGSSGAGLVQVILSGKTELKSIKIDPSLVDPKEVDVLEDLIIAAFNDAKARLENQLSDEMSKVTGGLNVPGLKLPFL